jgi:hypothetical protein
MLASRASSATLPATLRNQEPPIRMSEIPSAYPLILNKVASPNYVTPTLRRARLLDWLNEHANSRAVVIAADAGYGKTTLLWQWEREVDFPCYWYKLDRSDRDWTLHVSYLAQAVAQRHRDFGRRTHSMLHQVTGPGTSRPGVAAYLLAEMHERLTEPCTFIIDDWQYVNAVTEVRGLWNQILRDAPPTCRFVFASRSKPQASVRALQDPRRLRRARHRCAPLHARRGRPALPRDLPRAARGGRGPEARTPDRGLGGEPAPRIGLPPRSDR